jgi:hypothetical protein
MRRLPKTNPTLAVFLIMSDQPTALMAACQSNGSADLLWANPLTHDHRWEFALASAWNWDIEPLRYDHQIDWIEETGSTSSTPMMDEWDETLL